MLFRQRHYIQQTCFIKLPKHITNVLSKAIYRHLGNINIECVQQTKFQHVPSSRIRDTIEEKSNIITKIQIATCCLPSLYFLLFQISIYDN